MARNFSKMTKDELHSIVNSADFQEMDLADLNALRKAATAAGILDSFDGDQIAIKINNKTYTDIKNGNNYTAEEKALAKEARDEYNAEIRTARAKEILKRAKIVDGKYVFDSLLAGEANLLEKTGYQGKFTADKEVYQIGQQKDKTLAELILAAKQNAEKRVAAVKTAEKTVEKNNTVVSKTPQKASPVIINETQSENAQVNTPDSAVEEKTPSMPAELQKSYDFWNKFNENRKNTGISYQIDNIENQHLLVEAKKGDKTLFKGIDHGAKGFDFLKKDKDAEAYEMVDLLVKKAKIRNPKTIIRIKDNVKDEILRNKILIACAKNNMKPAGNLPEGFDFEELKELVKDLKTTADINDLAQDLYRDSEYGFGQEYTDENSRPEKEKEKKPVVAAGVVIRSGSEQGGAEKVPTEKPRTRRSAVAAVIDSGNNGNTPSYVAETPNAANSGSKNQDADKKDRNNNRAAGAVIVTGDKGKNNVRTNTAKNDEPKKKKGGFWANVWDKTKNAVLIVAIGAATILGLRSCGQSKEVDRKNDDIEALAQKNDSLLNVIDGKNKDIATYQKALEDCNESKKPKPVVRKKKPVVKTPVVKEPEKKPVVKTPVVKEPEKKPVVKTPVKEETREPVVVDMGKKHEPDNIRSTPSDQDLVNAKRGVVDFGRQHVKDDDLSSVDVFRASDVKKKSKETSAENGDLSGKTIDFYTALNEYYR